MEKISFGKIVKSLGLDINLNLDIDITEVSTDTRDIKKNSLFIALKGEHFDGSNYIDEAFKKGAVCCITENDKSYDSDGIVIVVEDTVKALQDISLLYRQQFNVNVIAITGSVGKTSTKEMVYTVLNNFSNTLKTIGNLNNHIGTPKTLLQLDKSHKNAVIEMGMDNFFQIEDLSNCVKPFIGVITNIGTSHIENLKSKDGIFKAKSEITSGLSDNGYLILNGDDTILMDNIDTFKHKVITYGIKNKNANIIAKDIEYKGLQTNFTITYLGKDYSCTIPCVGEHNVSNALVGVICGVLLGEDIKECCNSLKYYKNTGMRQNIVNKNGVIVIEDCYNASVDSMKASLSLFDIIKGTGKKIAILGDMLENGDSSKAFHKEIGEDIKKHNIDVLLTYGEFSKDINSNCSLNENYHFYDKDALSDTLKEIVNVGDILLFKASRGMKLEEVIFNLYDFLDKK